MARGRGLIGIVLGNLMGILHRVQFTTNEDGWLAECSCGWQSDVLPGRPDVEQAWQEHTSAVDLQQS